MENWRCNEDWMDVIENGKKLKEKERMGRKLKSRDKEHKKGHIGQTDRQIWQREKKITRHNTKKTRLKRKENATQWKENESDKTKQGKREISTKKTKSGDGNEGILRQAVTEPGRRGRKGWRGKGGQRWEAEGSLYMLTRHRLGPRESEWAWQGKEMVRGDERGERERGRAV